MEKLKLNDLDCCIASDLKLINALLGISSHSGKFSCPYCTGDMSLESGELRTYESLAKHHDDFVAKGSKMKDMQKFKNVIHSSLLKGEPASKVLSSIPPPELHLLMGGVNWGLDQLFQVMDNGTLKERMRTKGISVRGYQGGGLEAALEADTELEVTNPKDLFDKYINVCPDQGSRTIRTEEAVLITLSSLRSKILHANL